MHEVAVHGKQGFVATTDLTPFALEAAPGPEGFKSSGRVSSCMFVDGRTTLTEGPVEKQLDALSTSSTEEAGSPRQVKK